MLASCWTYWLLGGATFNFGQDPGPYTVTVDIADRAGNAARGTMRVIGKQATATAPLPRPPVNLPAGP